MDKLKRKWLQNEISRELKSQGYQNLLNPLVNIYVDMLMQCDKLKKQISGHKGELANPEILTDILDKLNEDIDSYRKALGLSKTGGENYGGRKHKGFKRGFGGQYDSTYGGAGGCK